MPYYSPVGLVGPNRFTIIEETALLQTDTPLEDFAYHFYKTRYDRLKGILKRDADDLRRTVKTILKESMHRQIIGIRKIAASDKEPMAWSMNWFRLRNYSNRPYNLTETEKDEIIGDFNALRAERPLLGQIFIYQTPETEMLLVAVALSMENPDVPAILKG